MVRLKNRYLLIQVLYPSAIPSGRLGPSAAIEVSPSLLTPQPPSSELLKLYSPTPDTIGAPHLLRVIRAQLAQLFGDAGAAIAGNGLAIKYWSNATSTLILRCRREGVRAVWAAVCFVRALGTVGKVGADEVVLRVVRCSGTMRKCEEEAIRRAKGMLGRARGLEAAAELLGAERLAETDVAMAEGDRGDAEGENDDDDSDEES